MHATHVAPDELAGRATLRDARAAMLAAATPLPIETVSLAEARDRALARTLSAPDDLVPFARSAMDGYAVRAADTLAAAHAPLDLPVRGAIYAGDLPGELEPGTAMAISTGAPLPFGADAVVPWEDVTKNDTTIVLRGAVAALDHVFPPGDDARRGDVLVREGELLTAGRAAMLASSGFAHVPVCRRPRVGIVCTGDELVAIEGTPRPGQVRNSNATLLALHAAADGAEVVLVERAEDRDAPLRDALRRALAQCDLVITTGGASTGERDLVKGILDSLGARFAFTSIAMRPSKPTGFARLGETLVAVLPGNPAAAFVAYVTLVRGVVRKLSGRTDCTPQRVVARVEGSLHAKRDRDFLMFGLLRHDGDGFVVSTLENQCSSLTRISADANALILVPPGEARYSTGARLEVEVLDWNTVTFGATA
jgi:molybdenum cofactor synthesis domain-containing protein